MLIQQLLFWFLALGAIVGALGLIAFRQPIYTVLMTILNFFCLGGLYLTLQAEFIAVIQIIVYAGAIMVLFLFVIMLLNVSEEDMEVQKFDASRGSAFLLGILFLIMMLYVFASASGQFPQAPETYSWGKVEPIGRILMTDFVFPFEMISVILLAALLGAVVIAKRHN